MARRHDDDPGLPLKLGPCSNGEHDPFPTTALVREAMRRTRLACDDNARRTGVSRREFLLSAAGMATALAVLAACSDESSGGSGGGTFRVPPDATRDPEAAREALGGDGLVIDVQGHLLEYDLDTALPAAWFGSGFPQAGCEAGDPRACFDTAHFLEEVFVRSDTTVAVLSAVPVAGPDNPLGPRVMAEAIRRAELLCGDGRLLMQGHALPNAGPLDEALLAMADTADRFPVAAWKAYTHAGGPGWFLDDHDPRAPQVGEAFVRQAVALGIPRIAVHKGLSGNDPFASPVDLGPAAARHPDVAFVAYHAGYEGGAEGPWTEATRGVGANRLVSTARDAGLAPGSNLYAELGSTWRSVMGDPTSAAHLLGKLLLGLGEDNVLWGTDSIWYGSPQDQLTAFRAFEIAPELQERFGYPALTAERKAKILGGNAARLYGIDPAAAPCRPSGADLEAMRTALPTAANRTYGPTTAAAARAHRRSSGWFPGGRGS
ncbi:MAG: amidohydrolase family protein [Acidimicrobiia bacterium]